jgi:hypothetical protein
VRIHIQWEYKYSGFEYKYSGSENELNKYSGNLWEL